MPTSEDRTTYKYKNTPEETNTRLVLREAVRRACENIASVSSSSPFFLRFDKIEPVDLTDEMCLVLLAAKLAEEDANTIASPDSDPRETVDPAVAADIKKGLWKPEYPDQLQMCATDPQKMSGKALSIWGLLSLERSRLWSDEVGRRARDLLNLELEQQEDVNVCEIDRPSNNESKKQRLSKIERTAMAVALHFEDPQRTAKSIAEEVGCSPSTLSKDLAFKRARETTREKVRKGHINRDNGVDGLVDPDYEDLD